MAYIDSPSLDPQERSRGTEYQGGHGMTNSRDAFLQTGRGAVATRNGAGVLRALPERGGTGYPGAEADPVARFRDELTAAGGHAHVVADHAAARARVVELVQATKARRVLIGRGPFL